MCLTRRAVQWLSGGCALAMSLLLATPVSAVRGGEQVPESSRQYDAVCAFSRQRSDYLPANNAFASGVLISPNVVLIAAHAVADPQGRTPLQQGFNREVLGPGWFAVRFRRHPDGRVGSVEQGAASFHDVPVASITTGGFDIAVATLAHPVTHIAPMPVTFDSRLTRASRVTIAGWGFDGPAHATGTRGRLNIGRAGYTGSAALGLSINWRGQYGNLYDSGGAVLIEGDCGKPVLIGVMTGPGHGTGLRAMLQQIQPAAASVATCDATLPEHRYTGPMEQDPPPGAWVIEPDEFIVSDPGSPVGQPWPGGPRIETSANRSSPFGPLTGSAPVGRAVFDLTDPSREEHLTKDRRDARRVAVHVWYPAASIARASASAFTRDSRAFASRLAPLLKLTGRDAEGAIRRLAPRSWDFATPDRSAAAPVVVMVHDVDRSPELYASTAEELASNGFLVLCVNHTFESVASTHLHSTGRPGPEARAILKARPDLYPAALARLSERWAADIEFAVRSVGESGLFAADTSRLCVVGHGVGGSVAAVIGATDHRVASVGVLSGDVPGGMGVPRVTTLVMDTAADESVVIPPAVPDRTTLKRLRLNAAQYAVYRGALIEWAEAKRLAVLTDGARVLVGTHDREIFSDAALARNAAASTERTRCAVNARIVEFANVTLRDAAPDLLAGRGDDPSMRTPSPLR